MTPEKKYVWPDVREVAFRPDSAEDFQKEYMMKMEIDNNIAVIKEDADKTLGCISTLELSLERHKQPIPILLGWQTRRPQSFLDQYPNASEYVMTIHKTEGEARLAGVPTKDMVNGRFTDESKAAVIVRPVYAFERPVVIQTNRTPTSKLRTVLKKAAEALLPLSNAVYNDNGDMTVQRPMPSADECISAYFVEKRISDILKEE